MLREKNLAISLLMDYYGDILTDKQKEVVDLYYNEDLSLAEIAEQSQITRQGVRDCIKRGEAILIEMEEKLGLAAKFKAMQVSINEIYDTAEEIDELNKRFCFSRDVGILANKIKETAEAIGD